MEWTYRLVGLASLCANGAVLASREPQPPMPIAAAAIVQSTDHGKVLAARGDDGLFHLAGRNGGRAVTFVVDTGASVTVLTAADAARLGAKPLGLAETVLATAGGSTAMSWSRIAALDVAGRRVGEVDVAVVRDGIGQSLLGQDILAQLGPLTIAGDELTLHAPRKS